MTNYENEKKFNASSLLLAVCTMIFSCNKLTSSDSNINQRDSRNVEVRPILERKASTVAFNDASMEIVSKMRAKVRNNSMLLYREDLRLETTNDHQDFFRSLGITESEINNFDNVIKVFIRENKITSETSPEDILKLLNSADSDIILYGGDCAEYQRKGKKIMRDYQVEVAGCALTGVIGGPYAFGACFTMASYRVLSDSYELDKSYPECSGMKVE